MAQQESDRDWRLDRRLQFIHIVTTLGAVVAMTLYVAAIRTDVTVLQSQQAAQRVRDDTQDEVSREKALEIKRQLERIDHKLDRLIEARGLR
jgi:hypothetical protein